MVRLGTGSGDMKCLTPDAIERGVATLRRMRQIADIDGAPVRAVATSAVREAENHDEFVARAREQAGVDVEVISGAEEARLIHLGILQALPVFDRRLLLCDIGGGSTEVLVGERGEVLSLPQLQARCGPPDQSVLPRRAVAPERGVVLPEVRPGHVVAVQPRGGPPRLRGGGGIVGHDPGGRRAGPGRDGRRAAALVQPVPPERGRRPIRGGRAGRGTECEGAAPSPRSRRQPGRHRPGRRTDPGGCGRDVRGRRAGVLRLRPARGGAARHDPANGRRSAPPPARCRGAACSTWPRCATRTRTTQPTSPAWRSSCSTASSRSRTWPPSPSSASQRANTSRPARCWPTWGCSWRTAVTTCTRTTSCATARCSPG